MKMDRFEIIKEIDEGAFGIVLMAKNRETKEIVAIKKIKEKFQKWEDCMKLREINSLRKLKHQNIIKLKEVFKLDNELFLVFEYCEKNLFKYYIEEFKIKKQIIPEQRIKNIIFQITKALSYMHQKGYFHRDMKPENLLITAENNIKIADFGLAREIRSSPPYTDYVSTRWYRAPEILLKSHNYNSPVDIFALGCIMAELYIQEPLFKGNSEIDQMNKICSILGTPPKSWVEGYKLAGQIGFNFPQYPKIPLENIIKNASPEAIDLLKNMLTFESSKRISSSKMLKHPYFKNVEKEDIVSDLLPLNDSAKSKFNILNDDKQILNKYKNNSIENENNFMEKNEKNKICLDFDNFISKTLNKENCFGEKTPRYNSNFVKTPEKIDQLLEELNSDYKNLEKKNSQSQNKFLDIEKNMNLLSNKKLIPTNKNILISLFENNPLNEKEKEKKKSQYLIDDQIEELLNLTPFKEKKIKSEIPKLFHPKALDEVNINKSPSKNDRFFGDLKLKKKESDKEFFGRNKILNDSKSPSQNYYSSYLSDINKLNKYAKSTYPYNF
jgi:serine/threonine protein kinase